MQNILIDDNDGDEDDDNNDNLGTKKKCKNKNIVKHPKQILCALTICDDATDKERVLRHFLPCNRYINMCVECSV